MNEFDMESLRKKIKREPIEVKIRFSIRLKCLLK